MSDTAATDHRNAAVAFADAVRSAHPDTVETVLLFGSTARGETRGRDSDVDLFVVVDERESTPIADFRDLAYRIGLGYGLTLSVHARNSETFESGSDPFVRKIREDGERLSATHE